MFQNFEIILSPRFGWFPWVLNTLCTGRKGWEGWTRVVSKLWNYSKSQIWLRFCTALCYCENLEYLRLETNMDSEPPPSPLGCVKKWDQCVEKQKRYGRKGANYWDCKLSKCPCILEDWRRNSDRAACSSQTSDTQRVRSRIVVLFRGETVLIWF